MQLKNNISRLIFGIIFFSFITNGLWAQSNEDCMMCHEDPELTIEKGGKTISLFVDINKYNKSAHRKSKCISCHKDANVEDFPHPEKLKKINCGDCHGDIASQTDNDIHYKLKDRVGENIPTCKVCHGTHNGTPPSKVADADKAKTFCGKCHDDAQLSAPYHTSSSVNEKCLECHEQKDYIPGLSGSVHSSLDCSNCHGYVVSNLDEHPDHSGKKSTADCYLCHSAIAKEHKESIHGISLSHGINEAAQCWDCHGSHNISKVESDSSMVHPLNLIATCGACHDAPDFAKEHELSIKQPGVLYAKSVHGKSVEAGNPDAATCVTCHGIHDIKNRIQIGSKISSVNIPNTCSECHKDIAEEYMQSVHWIGVKKGIRNSPTCNDCHSEHNIRSITTGEKAKEMRKMQEQTCLQCHNNLLLSERYGLEGGSAASYMDSYHGLAVMRGDDEAAMCIDCHGVHKILPKYHEESTVNESNVVETCKKCHEDATKVFSMSYSHNSTEGDVTSFAVKLAKDIYIWLILIVIGGMMLHNILIFRHDLIEKRRKIKSQIRIPRFTTNELIQHTFLLVSFLLLAITGFNLKFPDTWWAEILFSLGMDEGVRQLIHRVSAVVMIVLSVYHVVYLLITARGRFVLVTLLPNLGDIRQAISNVSYYLGLNKKHPEFDNYNYMEKAEYWALVWGTLLMGFTGFILWFPTLVGNWAPIWFIKVCEIIHFYEAILATLAIIVWHWFFVMFRPKEYPINFASIDGKMTVEHFKEEHKLRFKKVIIEWSELKSGKRSEKQLSHFTKFFIAAIEKNGMDIGEFVQSELDKDNELKAFIKKEE